MINLFRSILETIILLVSFVINLIVSIFQFIANIPFYLNYVVSLTSVVPTFALTFFTAGISLTLILLIINRQQGA